MFEEDIATKLFILLVGIVIVFCLFGIVGVLVKKTDTKHDDKMYLASKKAIEEHFQNQSMKLRVGEFGDKKTENKENIALDDTHQADIINNQSKNTEIK